MSIPCRGNTFYWSAFSVLYESCLCWGNTFYWSAFSVLNESCPCRGNTFYWSAIRVKSCFLAWLKHSKLLVLSTIFYRRTSWGVCWVAPTPPPPPLATKITYFLGQTLMIRATAPERKHYNIVLLAWFPKIVKTFPLFMNLCVIRRPTESL